MHILFFVSHGLVAAGASCLLMFGAQSGSSAIFSITAIASVLLLWVASWFTSRRIRIGLSVLEGVVADQESFALSKTGILEFDQVAERIGKLASRWESVAAETRTQDRDFQSLMLLLNRRGAKGKQSGEHLRAVLAEIGNSLHRHLTQIDCGTDELGSYARAIAEGADVQGDAIVKTTTHVEQLATTIQSVTSYASDTEKAVVQTSESASEAMGMIKTLIDGMEQVRNDSHNCDKKLRGLSDPSQQIGSIVGTISDIAARTDLLAVNASIESIRAGEHGRGFAIVADEVRKLAEQATDATREIANLVESMQLVTQDSIRGIVRQREQIEAELKRASVVGKAIEKICGASEQDSHGIHQITELSGQQLQLAQDVVLAIEQISEIAKSNRGSAESLSWHIKSLTKSTPQFNSAIDRLRMCGDTSGACLSSDEVESPLASVAIPVPLAGMVQV